MPPGGRGGLICIMSYQHPLMKEAVLLWNLSRRMLICPPLAPKLKGNAPFWAGTVPGTQPCRDVQATCPGRIVCWLFEES